MTVYKISEALTTVTLFPSLFKDGCRLINSQLRRITLSLEGKWDTWCTCSLSLRDDAKEKSTLYRWCALLLGRAQTRTEPSFQTTFSCHKAGWRCVSPRSSSFSYALISPTSPAQKICCASLIQLHLYHHSCAWRCGHTLLRGTTRGSFRTKLTLH